MIDSISSWFSSLDTTMQIFWACAIAASVVFLIQNALMLIGLGDMDTEVDAEASTDGDHDGTLGAAGIFSLFTLRNFINFFLGFGWGGISLAPVIKSHALLIFLSILCGLAFVAIFVVLLRYILRLERNGSFRIDDCVGKTASVYLRIPANHTSAGKVQVSVNGSVYELNAYTDGDSLPTGAPVRIVRVLDGGSLLVEKV